MRVGYELTGLELDRTGVARAVSRLREELEHRVDLVPLVHPGLPRQGRRGRAARGVGRELWWLPYALPRKAARLGLDLLHCPVGLAPVRSRVPTVITVHDVMALDHPEWFGRANVLQQRLVLARAARNAAAVITPSEFTRRRAVARLGLDPARVQVVPWDVDERFSPGPRPEALLARLGVSTPYLLAVGTLQPRKNLEAALSAFERIAARVPHALVVAGARGWSDEALVSRIRYSPVAGRVRLTGRVSDEDLVGLYRGADCLVYPSREEGFGFPPLEAMACGAPVVASDRSSIPEVVGDAGVLVDPDDGSRLAECLLDLLTSQARREEHRARGLERAREYTWSSCIRATVGAYRVAMGRA